MINVQPNKTLLKEYAKQVRKNYEAAGRDVDVNPTGTPRIVHVDTQTDDLVKLTALYAREQAGALVYPLEFKGGGVFYELTQPEFTVLADEAFEYIEALYSTESNAFLNIDLGNFTTKAQIDYVYSIRIL